MSDLVGNPKDRFSRVAAHIVMCVVLRNACFPGVIFFVEKKVKVCKIRKRHNPKEFPTPKTKIGKTLI